MNVLWLLDWIGLGMQVFIAGGLVSNGYSNQITNAVYKYIPGSNTNMFLAGTLNTARRDGGIALVQACKLNLHLDWIGLDWDSLFPFHLCCFILSMLMCVFLTCTLFTFSQQSKYPQHRPPPNKTTKQTNTNNNKTTGQAVRVWRCDRDQSSDRHSGAMRRPLLPVP